MKKPDLFLWRQSFLVFILFFGFALWAFWPSYYSLPAERMMRQERLHGVAMSWWCLLLILQASLIRFKWFLAHRWLGYSSYLVVPLVMITTHQLFYRKMNRIPEFIAFDYSFAALVYFSLLAFLILYGLAIYHRKNAAVHARYMACTIFPMLTPISDRIIARNFPSLMDLVPTIEGNPILPTIGFILADAIIIILAAWDLFSRGKKWVFPTVLLILVLFQATVYFLYTHEWWQWTLEKVILRR